MNPNPYAPPVAPSGNAKDAVNVPSILLIITGALNVLLSLMGLVSPRQDLSAMMGNGDPNVARQMEQFKPIMDAAQRVGPVTSLIGIAVGAFVIYGALQMRSLKGYGLAMGSAIVALIPCFGCYCVGIPVGIWALVVLSKADVKASFT